MSFCNGFLKRNLQKKCREEINCVKSETGFLLHKYWHKVIVR